MMVLDCMKAASGPDRNTRGKEIEDPFNRLGAVGRMEGGKHQVTGLGRMKGKLHGLRIPHFSDVDDARGLSQSILESFLERERVYSYFPLGD